MLQPSLLSVDHSENQNHMLHAHSAPMMHPYSHSICYHEPPMQSNIMHRDRRTVTVGHAPHCNLHSSNVVYHQPATGYSASSIYSSHAPSSTVEPSQHQSSNVIYQPSTGYSAPSTIYSSHAPPSVPVASYSPAGNSRFQYNSHQDSDMYASQKYSVCDMAPTLPSICGYPAISEPQVARNRLSLYDAVSSSNSSAASPMSHGYDSFAIKKNAVPANNWEHSQYPTHKVTNNMMTFTDDFKYRDAACDRHWDARNMASLPFSAMPYAAPYENSHNTTIAMPAEPALSGLNLRSLKDENKEETKAMAKRALSGSKLAPLVNIECAVCTAVCADRDALLRHATQYHSKRCGFCGKMFARNSNLKEHTRIHTGVSPYVCHVCKRGFKQQHSLKDHLRIHTGEKPFCCTLCPKRFTVKNNLKVHMRVHTGEKPYQCGVCFKRFTQKGSLNTHLRKVHNQV